MNAPGNAAIGQPRLLCLISARNLGDAVVHARFLRELVAQGYAQTYVVWTFTQARFLFDDIPSCTIVTSDFPIGASMKSFVTGGFLGFFRALGTVFKHRPEEVLELISDFRERILSTALWPKRRLYIHWDPDHPFRHHAHIPVWRGSPFVDIPSQTASVYAAYRLSFAKLTGAEWRAAPLAHKQSPSGRRTIALHPLASRTFKLWPMERWEEFAQTLTRRGFDLVLFGAPSDRPQLDALAARLDRPVEVFARSLPEFVDRLRSVDLLVGLDSFSIHLANDMRLPTILLNGANDPRVFSPLDSLVANRPGVCPHQPCYGRTRCVGTDFQYVCMTSIATSDVLSLVDATCRATP